MLKKVKKVPLIAERDGNTEYKTLIYPQVIAWCGIDLKVVKEISVIYRKDGQLKSATVMGNDCYFHIEFFAKGPGGLLYYRADLVMCGHIQAIIEMNGMGCSERFNYRDVKSGGNDLRYHVVKDLETMCQTCREWVSGEWKPLWPYVQNDCNQLSRDKQEKFAREREKRLLKERQERVNKLAEERMNRRRVVCAAIKHPLMDQPIIGIRYDSPDMEAQKLRSGYDSDSWTQAIQGFVDQNGIFMEPREAYIIAKAAGQILRGSNTTKELTVEQIY